MYYQSHSSLHLIFNRFLTTRASGFCKDNCKRTFEIRKAFGSFGFSFDFVPSHKVPWETTRVWTEVIKKSRTPFSSCGVVDP